MKKTIFAALLSLGALNLHAVLNEDVEVPYVPFEIKMGKHFDLVQANCLTCHSFGYILNQGKQSRSFWKEKVEKMVDAFKAPITKEDQALITDYLAEQYGNGQP
ncbi:sulfite:cytochrome C oxidoreductase subunit B [Sulfurimonas sp. HSL-3221]|uniref:sulfite:cytochrome C oxidoreductase subunit B n=1 Tax=Sulfurimonadaceae TaxID=2771471 RepID=UPI001E3C4367|nr:sulfite:cytochrome C oxidoreductase subunit B [Sulfurimonas sp. HSL-3221]UFS63436.1 sulfite:cytochrome C oxidoreductase subunit B [Sulfurimonas sp. HSL-3221]